MKLTQIIQVSLGTLIFLLSACGEPENISSEKGNKQQKKKIEHTAYIEKGDMPAIQKRRILRILSPRFSDKARYLPRKGLPLHYEKQLLTEFAAAKGLAPVWIYVDKFSDLIPKLIAGEGDVISANMTATKQRMQSIEFTSAVDSVREQLVVAEKQNISKLADMHNKSIAIQKSSSFWDTAQELQQKNPAIKIQTVSEGISTQGIVDAVADGKYDATIADSNLMDAILSNSDGIKTVMTLRDDRKIAFGLRKNNVKLKFAIDTFIQQQKLTEPAGAARTDDLAEIKKRKVLRVLTRNNAATYYLWRGELVGFEYELVREFAKQLGVRLEMIVVPGRDDLLAWLKEGRGDLVAASMTIDSKNFTDISYSKRYNIVNEVVVSRTDEKKTEQLEDLNGRKLVVRQSSSYWQSLKKLKEAGATFEIIAAPESMETEEIIAKVADGTYDLTIADSHIMEIELAWRDDVKQAFILGKEMQHGWVVRKSNSNLLNAVNEYIKKSYRGTFYNIAKEKYFKKKRRIAKQIKQRVDGTSNGTLSPYDDLVKPLAQQYQFDWRLVVSQMYQESRFDPKAKSWVGATGLMQVMPRTAKELGIKSLEHPENGVKAGIQYLGWLDKRFSTNLSAKDKMWFMLASYNAGLGHVKDARRLAKQQGWNPDQWFGHVEKAMLLLSNPKYFKKTRFGYVRGREPVNYVRDIRDRYRAYVQLTAS